MNRLRGSRHRIRQRLLGVIPDLGPVSHLCGQCAVQAAEGFGKLRDDIAKVADQRHVDRTVDADRGAVALHIDPLAVRIARFPGTATPVIKRLTKFGADGKNHVRTGGDLTACF